MTPNGPSAINAKYVVDCVQTNDRLFPSTRDQDTHSSLFSWMKKFKSLMAVESVAVSPRRDFKNNAVTLF